jgi:hypothetical protein
VTLEAATAVKSRKQPREHGGLRSSEKPGHVRNASIPVTAHIPVTIVERIDTLIEKGLFENRSDFVREAVRRLLIEYEKMFLHKEPQPVLGVNR